MHEIFVLKHHVHFFCCAPPTAKNSCLSEVPANFVRFLVNELEGRKVRSSTIVLRRRFSSSQQFPRSKEPSKTMSSAFYRALSLPPLVDLLSFCLFVVLVSTTTIMSALYYYFTKQAEALSRSSLTSSRAEGMMFLSISSFHI